MTYCQPCYCTLEIKKEILQKTIDEITDFASIHFNVKKEILKGKLKITRISNIRFLLIFYLRNFYGTKQIGKYFDNRDHSSICYVQKKMKDIFYTEPEMVKKYEDFVKYMELC